jgi:DNA modification methylase
LNKVSGEWDDELLADLLKELQDDEIDLTVTGFDFKEIDEILKKFNPEVIEDDFDVDQEIPPVVQLGEIWQLGRHRLMCGDSTNRETVDKLIDGHDADLILTDPPYNVDYEGKTSEKLKIRNDVMNDQTYLTFLSEAFSRMNENSKAGAAAYVCHADSEGYNVRTAFKQAGYRLRQCLVWIKNTMVMGRQDYQWKHEPILYGWKEGAGHSWYSDRKQTTVVEFDRPSSSKEHPTMKPIGLCGYLMQNSSKQGDIILDLFGGSGSTLIAAEQLKRICYMMELDPHYCDVIIKRWETLTGEVAVKQ